MRVAVMDGPMVQLLVCWRVVCLRSALESSAGRTSLELAAVLTILKPPALDCDGDLFLAPLPMSLNLNAET